ncbi:hypothetical protein C8Q79DRAFT_128907 [Trametes meyenii]|nr:hypothetical protein C8Q79DRAFT_128907 [Trametes meyenii]
MDKSSAVSLAPIYLVWVAFRQGRRFQHTHTQNRSASHFFPGRHSMPTSGVEPCPRPVPHRQPRPCLALPPYGRIAP